MSTSHPEKAAALLQAEDSGIATWAEGAVSTAALRRELRLLGEIHIPKDSLERVWLLVLREMAKAGEAQIPAQGSPGAGEPSPFNAPASGPGMLLPGCLPVLASHTPPACPRPSAPRRAEGESFEA